MPLNLPEVSKLIYELNGNEAWHHFDKATSLDDIQVISTNPFVVENNGINYLLTSDKGDNNIGDYDYVLLTTKKPTRQNVVSNKVIIKRWLKHIDFINATPEEVVASWKGKFNLIKEDTMSNIKGLRPPQVGALYSILAHIENPEDQAVIVMPTGTGKTETMLATLISNECKKLRFLSHLIH